MQLLQLETEWRRKQDDKIEAITLSVYNQMRKDQVRELEQELLMVRLNPAFSALARYSTRTYAVIMQCIRAYYAEPGFG